MTLQPAKIKPYLLLLVILLIAFLPVSSFYFAMKNDAFSDNFPNKFFFTEAIRSGFLPLWNPYLNFGFPIYSDPGFAFWSPVTWFFGTLAGYSAYTLTAEVLLYIYLAGITMFRLARHFDFTVHVALAVASMYMCSGFFTGELQHINFLTAAAFLPFLLQQFLVLLGDPNYKNAFLLSISIYMVFTGGHPAIPVGTIYFLTSLTIVLFILNKTHRQNWKSFFLYYIFSILIFILLYSPALYSIGSVLSEYKRGGSLNQFDETAYGFSPTSYLSFFYPFATVKNASFLTDDLSMRNVFFSLGGFAFVITQLNNKNSLTRALIIVSCIMLLLSSGGYIKGVLFSNLPLLKYIRTNGEYRIFSILCLTIVAGFGMNQLETVAVKFFSRFKVVITILLIVSFLILFFAIIKSDSRLVHLINLNVLSPITIVKTFIDNLTFFNTLLISATIQAVVILLLIAAKTNTKKIALIIIADLIINSIGYLPFTGVGTVRISEIQKVYNTYKKGITIPPLIALKNIDTFSSKQAGLVGSASFYNKKIGITNLTNYPSYFSNTETYFKSDLPNTLNNLPYFFLKKDLSGITERQSSDKDIAVTFFSPQSIRISVTIAQNDSIVFLQNYYKFWKAKVDGRVTPINKSLITFMAVPITKGDHLVEFYYKDKWLLLFVLISLTTAIIIIIYFFKIPLTNAFIYISHKIVL